MAAPGPALQSVGNYDLVEKIAEGGMGTVYKGRHRESGQIVAIKIVAQHMIGNQVLIKRFEQEYKAAQQLDHPNIVRALEYGDSGSTPYLVMEYVAGESLGKRIEREGRMSEKEAVRIIAQVAQGLHRAHKERLIHRDVKPDNILVTPDGTAKLADLGLVKEVEAELNLTRTGRGLGTPHFMSPEQFKNAKNADPRCDIYSLGATLYMMVTGELPFRSSGPLDAYMKKIENKLIPPKQLVPGLSDRVDWAIRRAMDADPDRRPTSCREFVEDLTGRSTRKPTSESNVPQAAPQPQAPAQAQQQDVWYLVYKDDEGVTHTVKGTTAGIRRSLREGLLGDASNVRASRQKNGTFESLRSFPEFRDLVVTPSLPSGPNLQPASSRPTPAPGPAPAPGRGRPTRPAEETSRPSAPSSDPKRAPHIVIQSSDESAPWPLWLRVLALMLLVIASAVAGFFLLPLITSR